MEKNKLLRPFVKWAGGKRQLLEEIRKYIPKNFSTYYEPFLGGGAVLFDLQPKRFVINDINSEMINVYRTVQSDVESLVNELFTYKNSPDFFYKIREIDRSAGFAEITGLKRAARIIYLNKTCFNGLFRVNSRGQFNVPFGSYTNPDFINETTLRAVNKYLNEPDGKILNVDFEEALQDAGKGSFVYIDPPYDPVSDSSSFTGYTLDGFGKEEQRRLKLVCDNLSSRGSRFLLSNSATDFINNLYSGYRIEIVRAKRHINASANGRGAIDEVLIRNFE